MVTTITETCRCCKQAKSIDELVKDKYAAKGYKRLCKQCNSDKMKAYHKSNPDKSREALYKWRDENKQYWSDYLKHRRGVKKDFKLKGREMGLTREEALLRMKEIKTQYDKAHQKESREYRQSNKERDNQNKRVSRRKRGLIDPSYKMRTTLRSRFGALIRSQSSSRALELLGCDMPFFLRWMERNFEQGMTWKNHGRGPDKWNIDHNIPCASFDLIDVNQQKQCFHWSNLFPMWEKHNNAKRADIWIFDYQI